MMKTLQRGVSQGREEEFSLPGNTVRTSQKENCMSKELYVGNLPYETNEEELKRLFTVAGTVTSVHIITDPETGASKGCAYVRMATAEEAAEAVESLNDALVGARMMTVSIARPQKQQQKRPGGYKGKSRPGGRTGKGGR